MSPITSAEPDPLVVVSDQDMNSWDRVDPAAGPQVAWSRGGGHALYRAKLAPPKSMQTTGGVVLLNRVVASRVEAWLDGERVASHDGPIDGPWQFAFGTSSAPRQLTLRVASDAGAAGLAGPIELRQHGQGV
jgi:hypothetical protein